MKAETITETSMLLHVLRNPHGYSREELRKYHRRAADHIESLVKAIEAWNTRPDQWISVEKLAEEEHEIWASWMEYLFSEGTYNEDGTWTMPAWAVKRWTRQMGTTYRGLSESEKQSVRDVLYEHHKSIPLPTPPGEGDVKDGN